MTLDIKTAGEIARDAERAKVREFESGATRDADTTKLDYEGFLSPAVLTLYAEYLHKHRVQSDGQYRDSDNWQKGMPKDVYMKSAIRHLFAAWTIHREGEALHYDREDMFDSLCAVMFNVMGYLFEELRGD